MMKSDENPLGKLVLLQHGKFVPKYSQSSSSVRVWEGMYFVNSMCDLHSTVTVVYTVSFNIVWCNVGTLQYLISLPCFKAINHVVSQRHVDVIKWKHFPHYWPFVQGIHPSPMNSPHKGQWRGALMFSLICAWINGWVNNREAGDLRRYRAHYDVTVMHAW